MAIKEAEDWMIKILVDGILDFFYSFKQTEFSCIIRKIYGAAHSIAKFGCERANFFE